MLLLLHSQRPLKKTVFEMLKLSKSCLILKVLAVSLSAAFIIILFSTSSLPVQLVCKII